jgi:hypothetical protein
MFGQKFTNTNEMLQYGRIHCADFGGPKLGELNTALVGRGAPPSVEAGEAKGAVMRGHDRVTAHAYS